MVSIATNYKTNIFSKFYYQTNEMLRHSQNIFSDGQLDINHKGMLSALGFKVEHIKACHFPHLSYSTRLPS